MKVIESLIPTSTYPIPTVVLQRIAVVRGLNLEVEATAELINSKEYNLADADIQLWLSTAPDISQSGVSVNLTDKVRESLKKEANKIYKKYGDSKFSGVTYGYKGSRL